MKLVLSLMLSVCLHCFAADLPSTLKVGTNAEFAPFSFIEKGEIVGFEIDVAKEVASRLGCQMELKDLPFEALIPELSKGRLHFVAAGMTVTEERAKVVNFSTPYLSGDPLVAVFLTEKKLSPNDLPTTKIVVNEGFTADLFVTDQLGLTPIRLQSPTDAIIALKAKRTDVFITAQNTLKPLLAIEPEGTFSHFVIEGTNENCALMISKKMPELVAKINGALSKMEQDGTLASLKAKWGLQ